MALGWRFVDVTRGKAGHYWRRKSTDPFEPMAVVLTSSGTYSIPSGATTLKAWAVGSGGGQSYAGGTAYKTWTSVSNDDSAISFTVGVGGQNGSAAGESTTLTFRGTTITGQGGNSAAGGGPGGSYSGGDGGANGGVGGYKDAFSFVFSSGAVGGNGTWDRTILRTPATDVSGLLDAVSLAGLKVTEDGGTDPAFGSGGGDDAENGVTKSPGIGGGGVVGNGGRGFRPGGSGAVVLYFT